MDDHTFTSGIGAHIQSFIEQKQAIGYPYRSSTRILRRFDTMVASIYPGEDTITKEICDAWLRLKADEHPNGLLRRVTPVRQLAKYMNGCGQAAYVLPGHIPDRQIKYEAHVYTEGELRAFFESVDACQSSPFSPTRCYVIPVLFRLIYCCGLRNSEARLLKSEDIDLDTGKVMIRESKGWKARVVYMADDLLDVCREFNSLMEELLPGRAVFFANKDDRPFGRSTIDRWFHGFWDNLPEAALSLGNPGRVHDFRHAYAIDRLNRWVAENQDINALYPYLSEYMGHSSYADTDYYLRLCESFYPEMERLLWASNQAILPEVCHES